MYNTKFDHVFVFGSNLSGRHGAGAALDAVRFYGAEYGVGEGRTGQAYALPTKDRQLKTLPLRDIEFYIRRFFEYAKHNVDEVFVLTPVGTGLAGYYHQQIWDLIQRNNMPENVVLSSTWVTDWRKVP